ncbi:Ies3p Ecym_1458 [Eremothecium cymbalariae DBVPG|uniref:Uncharacterized protein n=1 Tax=Eremothecium cymbalariae (strain CBS 270.75 / DBVPG 7215 / KCTC 17166 / NRRL Y-17582) TaxID=931890 RepID=G8JMG7_ERECY|nr:hypothetical protein Ecym_1458 [Eremothecium cymbalariae DBVPG\
MSDLSNTLFRKDIQLVYSNQAVKRYEAGVQEIDDDRKSGHKRHIICVDDHLKINYEVVKNVPGNLIELTGNKGKQGPEIDEITRINKFKSLYYKEQLNKLHDDFVTKSSSLRGDLEPAQAIDEPLPSLQQQHEWLKEIQAKLLKQYEDTVQEEKRWYMKKEVMLDANIKLDLFSTKDKVTGAIKLGKDNAHKSCIF